MSLKAISNAYPLPNGTVGQVLTMVAGTPPKPDWANSASALKQTVPCAQELWIGACLGCGSGI